MVLRLLEFSVHSSFFGMTSMGLAQSVMLLEMIPAFSSCLISCFTNSLYFNGMVYRLDANGRPSVRMSNSIRLVLPMSAVDLETILLYLISSSCWSLFLVTLGIMASGMDFTISLVLDSNCKLVAQGILGSNLELLGRSCSWVTSNLSTSWICSHLPAGADVAMGDFSLN